MRKSRRNPQLAFIIRRQMHAHPLSECRRAFANVYRHIKHFAHHAAHQFALRMRRYLIMQATQNTFGRARVVILHKLNVITYRLVELSLIETFEKKSHARHQTQQAR